MNFIPWANLLIKLRRVAVLLTFSLSAAVMLSSCGSSETNEPPAETKARVEFWTCSMHPQIKQPQAGLCPLCAMDLVPVTAEDGGGTGPRELKLSAAAMKLASVQTAPVQRRFVTAEIRLDGKIEYDESRLSYITAWVPGRIDRLYVDYTGVRVSKGDHLVSLYSPELLTTQQELLLGLKMLKSGKSRITAGTRKNVAATREKLRLWGLTEKQIRQIEASGKASDHTTIYSPGSGIVVEKNGFEGMYVQTGTRIYTVADLSRVWVKLDAYESDLMWIRYGQAVEFETKAFPGQTFKGQVTFIDPILNPATRTVKVRVNVANPDGKLKPEMFVTARVYPRVALGGRVMDPALAGKWICPMHPEIIKAQKSTCDVCGMDLVTTESLGYAAGDVNQQAPLVIPVSAPLITGRRAVVYVARPQEEGLFEGREIVLGPRAGQHYIVMEGLQEGELVVVNGNFKIDSALQILAKPSMMSPKNKAPGSEQRSEAPPEVFAVPQAFTSQTDKVLDAYFGIHHALSRDRHPEASAGAAKLLSALEETDMSLLEGKSHLAWMEVLETLQKSAGAMATAKSMDAARQHFSPLSDSLAAAVKQFGPGGQAPVYRFFCPMAFDNQGARWLQRTSEVENPYFGSMMFKCGTKEETITAEANADHEKGSSHD